MKQLSAPEEYPASTLVKSKEATWLGLFGVALLFLALRWNSFNLALIRDEGEYAYAGNLLRHGLAPYQHAFLQKPPMIAYTYALAGILAPHVFWFPVQLYRPRSIPTQFQQAAVAGRVLQ